MTAVKYIGNAVAIKDVYTSTIALTWGAGDTGTWTVNGKTLTFTIGTLTTTPQVATTAAQAFNSATFTDTTASCAPTTGGRGIPEFSEYTATVSGSTVILTANTAGIPGPTITASESTAGTGTHTIAHTTSGTGPNSWNNTANWDGGALPSAADDVTIDVPVSILYDLDQSGAALTLASLTITARFGSSSIGLPVRNANGYNEFRKVELTGIGVTTFKNYSAAGLIKINFGTVQNASTLYATGTSTESGRPACQLRGTHASNTLTMLSLTPGSGTNEVGWGANGETATVATVNQDIGTLTIGSAVTLTTLNIAVGTANLYVGGTTLTQSSGTVNAYSGAWTTVTVWGGTHNDFGTSTYTTLNVNNTGVYNADCSEAAKTITNTNLNDSGEIINVLGRLTHTNPIAYRGRLTASAT